MSWRKQLPPWTLPDEFVITLPFRYRVRVKKYHQRNHGGWTDFDKSGWAEIYIKATDPYDEQLDTLRHEMEHMVCDFGGILRKMENDYRAFKQEDE